MLALIDADILVYRVGFTTQDKDEYIAAYRCDESINGILNALQPEGYLCFLTSQDKDNFRHAIYPQYKNRPSNKPLHYAFIREHLVNYHNCHISVGEEADDRLGIEATSHPGSVICSIDKDLRQIPGRHYNFVKGILDEVTPLQGLKSFYAQLLEGDRTDTIPGLDGIGKVISARMVSKCTNEEEMYAVCCEQYKLQHPEHWKDLLRRNGQLLKIRTYEGEIWLPPDEREATPSLSAAA